MLDRVQPHVLLDVLAELRGVALFARVHHDAGGCQLDGLVGAGLHDDDRADDGRVAGRHDKVLAGDGHEHLHLRL